MRSQAIKNRLRGRFFIEHAVAIKQLLEPLL